MAALGPVPANTHPAAVERIVALMAGFSIEATRPSAAASSTATVQESRVPSLS